MINTITLVGNITFEGRFYNKNGIKAYSNSIAFNEVTTKNGKKIKKVQYIKFKCFGGFADFLNKHLKKGARVTVHGSLSFEEYLSKKQEKCRDAVIKLQTIDIQGDFYSENEFEEPSGYSCDVDYGLDNISDEDLKDFISLSEDEDKSEEDLIPVDDNPVFETNNEITKKDVVQKNNEVKKETKVNIFLQSLGLE